MLINTEISRFTQMIRKYKRIDEDYFDHVDDLAPDIDVEKELEDDAEALNRPKPTLHLDFDFSIVHPLMTASEVARISKQFIKRLNYILKISGDVITPSEPIYPSYEEENTEEDDEGLPEVKRINFNHFGNSDLSYIKDWISDYFTLRLDCVSNMKTIGEVHRLLTAVFNIKVPSQIPNATAHFISRVSVGGTENSAMTDWVYGVMWEEIWKDKHKDRTEFINIMGVFCEHLLPTEPGTDWAEEVKEFYTKRYYDGKEKYPLYGK